MSGVGRNERRRKGQSVPTDFLVSTEVEVTVHDPSVLDRVNDPDWLDHMGWHPSWDERDALKHFAYNCLVNGIEDIRRLDGWADAPEGAVSFIVRGSRVEDWEGN